MENERILLVVPCYNDVARLSEFLPELATGLTAKFRVLVSDDGSEVKERQALQRWVEGGRGERLHNQQAVKKGKRLQEKTSKKPSCAKLKNCGTVQLN